MADTKSTAAEAEVQTASPQVPQGESSNAEPVTEMLEVTHDLPIGPPMVCSYENLANMLRPACCSAIEKSEEDILCCIEESVNEAAVIPMSDAKEPIDVPLHNDGQTCNKEIEGLVIESQPEGATPLNTDDNTKNIQQDKTSKKKKKAYTPTQMRTRKKDLYNKPVFE